MYKRLQQKIKEVASKPEVNELVDTLVEGFHNMHENGIESLKAEIRQSLELELDGLRTIAEHLDEKHKAKVLRRIARIEKELE